MSKRAGLDHPIHELIAERWSRNGFADRPVSDDDLRSLLEAARWAPSPYNEQPWRYFLFTRNHRKNLPRGYRVYVKPTELGRDMHPYWSSRSPRRTSPTMANRTRRPSTIWVWQRPT